MTDFSKLNFTTTDKATADHGVKALTYGAAGSGKTTLCGTMPNPIIISAEAGLMSIGDKKLPVITVQSLEDVQLAYEWVRTQAASQGLQSVCLDSISEIIEQVLTNAKAKTKDPRQAYGEMAEQGIKLIKSFRDLQGFNVLITAKQKVSEDPVTGMKKAMPTAPGQIVSEQLPYLFDLVMHAFTDKDAQGATYHALRTRASFNAEAKDRSGKLDELEYPDMGNIINKINQ